MHLGNIYMDNIYIIYILSIYAGVIQLRLFFQTVRPELKP